ncbi:hypothetical protein [Pseudoxanthomonas wuyuanensis]|uniref:Uncharacterized protein n=1 Tax=Pseudoxanthomonas wuyuanensis TaxID=1073196 RepID=A0A286CW19_9GAMM|nr:hypothetical protein [Pseudoxanthomonas wuyuanensis]KAF1721249.1 hypothetical protein CSC75_07480 [Pseudoxanthomonas wuyuanensis]SOD50565.1 hypothetical protein SAMN06296416_101185 [Pseudoxanthomonas wuyuanensis]
MKPPKTTADGSIATAADTGDFSLVVGGPLYRLFLKTRLVRPPLDLVHRRMLVIPALAWLPLLALTVAEGNAVSGVVVPFLQDVETYARFLVALPILLFAELMVHARVREIVWQFRERGIVAEASMPRFEEAIAGAMRWRNSIAAEIALLALVFLLGPWVWQHGLALQTDTWYASADAGRIDLNRAGWWFVHISAPIFQFLLLRWYFRLALWWRFLWQVSRLPLELKATHPDRAGGLGFLGESVSGFMPVLFGQGVVVSGIIFSRVLTGANDALEFRNEIVVLVILLVAMVVVPLLFFSPDLMEARRVGLRKYGALATTYVREFERKWLQGGHVPAGDPLVGSADIQSLADLAGSSDIVREMWPVAFDLRTLLQLVAATATPFLPLVLTVIPFAELVKRVLGMMF